MRRPRVDRGTVKDPREGYTVAGVSNRDARAVYDVRARAMRELWNDGQADERALHTLGQLFLDALRLELWEARRLTGFAAFAEEVIGVQVGRAEALAEAASARTGESATPLTERTIALWLRTEAGLYEGDEHARARVRTTDQGPLLEITVSLGECSTALAGVGARHLPLARARDEREYEENLRDRDERPRDREDRARDRDDRPRDREDRPRGDRSRDRDDRPRAEARAPRFTAEEELEELLAEGPAEDLEHESLVEHAEEVGSDEAPDDEGSDDEAPEDDTSDHASEDEGQDDSAEDDSSEDDESEDDESEDDEEPARSAPTGGVKLLTRKHARDDSWQPSERPQPAAREQRGAFGARNDRPRSDNDRPRFGGGNDRPRNDRPQFGGNDRPRSGGNDRPRFGNNDRPRFGGGNDRPRNDRPQFGGNDRPRFGGGTDRPQFGGNDRPRSGNNDRPRFGGGNDRPRSGGNDRPQFGGDRPRFGGNDRPRFNNDRNDRPRSNDRGARGPVDRSQGKPGGAKFGGGGGKFGGGAKFGGGKFAGKGKFGGKPQGKGFGARQSVGQAPSQRKPRNDDFEE